MAVGFELYQVPIIHFATYRPNRSILIKSNKIEAFGKPVNGHA